MASRRNYVTTTEVDELIGSGTSTDLQISEAEEIIDAYVGPQNKFLDYVIEGRVAASASGANFTVESTHQNIYDIDFFKWCEVEIIGGTGVGQRKIITASTVAGVLTVISSWSTALDTTSFYRIYQLGKFPRKEDVTSYSTQSPTTYYKQIVENIKRAVACQVEYMTSMGASFFTTDQMSKSSESIGDYSYSVGGKLGSVGIERMIAPKAKLLLRGFKNRLGEIVT